MRPEKVARFGGWAVTAFLTVLSAALLALSFPDPGFSSLAWIALVPLLFVLKDVGPGRAFVHSLLFGYVHALLVFRWAFSVEDFGFPAIFLLAAYLALFPAFFGLAFNLLSGRGNLPGLIAAPFPWVATEFLRSRAGFLALPLNLLGHSQHEFIEIIQIADLAGAYGVSFLVVLVNGALFDGLLHLIGRRNPERRGLSAKAAISSGAIALSLFSASFMYGQFVEPPVVPGESLNVILLQTNFPQNVKWDPSNRAMVVRKQIELTTQASPDGDDLVIWPETAVPGDVTKIPIFFVPLREFVRRIGTPLLLGSEISNRSGWQSPRPPLGLFNSAVLLSRDGSITGRYDKIRLVPFREYLPFKEAAAWPEKVRSSVPPGLSGKTPMVFSIDGRRVGVAICWESIFPELFFEYVRKGAQFMVLLYNEVMFGDTSAPHQFLAATVFRAVENRIFVAQSSNGGPSCIIGPRGEIVDRVREGGRDLLAEGTLTRSLPPGGRNTVYNLYGDMFAGATVVIAAGMSMVVSFAQRRGERGKHPDGILSRGR